jgi:hypothetical protein
MVSGRSLATGGLPASGGQDGSATAGRSRLARSPVAPASLTKMTLGLARGLSS